MQQLNQAVTINRSPIGPDELIKASEKTRKGFEALFKNLKFSQCSRCSEEWTKLNPNGLCPSCADFDKNKSENEDLMKRIFGKNAYEKQTLEKFKTDTDERKKVHELALKFRPEKDNLYLYGVCRSGKTHIANAIAQEWFWILRGSVAIYKLRYLVRILQSVRGYEQENEIINIAKKKLLIIDDIGIEKSSEWALGIIYDILEHRINQNLNGLIITSNHDIDSLAEKFGDHRLSSRINEMCAKVPMTNFYRIIPKLENENMELSF